MKLKLTKHGECPPEGGGRMGFRYTHQQDGYVSHCLDRTGWLADIKKHCEDNGYPPVDPAAAIDQLCKLLPPGWCKYENGEKPQWFIDARLTARDILHGTTVLASFIWRGMPLVSRELAASRSSTCARCYLNIPISGCAPCLGLTSLIDTVGGSIKTPSDASLRSCAACKCSNKAQTRLPIDLLAKGITPEQRERLTPFCWKRAELDALDNAAASQ